MNSYIGIIGGVGPYSSALLYQRICELSPAIVDQDHPGIIMTSIPSDIHDRTNYLFNRSTHNPAEAVKKHFHLLREAGCKIFGIPCNTMHAEPIWSIIEEEFKKYHDVLLVNMVDSVAEICNEKGYKRIILLCTKGTFYFRQYHNALDNYDIQVVNKNLQHVDLIHDAINNQHYGIKKEGKFTYTSLEIIQQVLLAYDNYDAVILGCTELSSGINLMRINNNADIVCSINILAEKLIFGKF